VEVRSKYLAWWLWLIHDRDLGVPTVLAILGALATGWKLFFDWPGPIGVGI
jgi:hypothetical protein